MIRRALALRCPVCGERTLIRRWFGIVERCPTCDLKVERIEGHMLGYVGLNTIVCFTLTFLVILVGALLTVPDVPGWPLLLVALVPAALGPVLFFPFSRTLWTAIDLLLRPLGAGEVDPRYVLVDPDRDRPGQV